MNKSAALFGIVTLASMASGWFCWIVKSDPATGCCFLVVAVMGLQIHLYESDKP